jgi:hypothetical protein
MKRKSSAYKSRKAPASEQQLAGLRASATARKQETVERLRTAIESLKSKEQAITAQNIYAECGLHYASYVRNDEAIALFRANSTHIVEKKKRARRKRATNDDSPQAPRDSLMAYKKTQLVTRLREAMQQIQELKQQQAVLVDAYLQREARVAELEANLKELEPYRSFVEQVRIRVRQEEYTDDKGDTPDR